MVETITFVFHSLNNIFFVFSLVGFKRNLSLLDIFKFSGGLHHMVSCRYVPGESNLSRRPGAAVALGTGPRRARREAGPSSSTLYSFF